jgi:hypothetical protein
MLETSLMRSLLLLILELAVIHQARNWRLGGRGNFNQVDIGLFGHPEGLPRRHDAERFVFDAHQAQFRNVDLCVEAMSPFAFVRGSDAVFSEFGG